MKIGRSSPAGRTATIRPTQGAGGIKPTTRVESAGASGEVVDVMTIAGIPETDLAPKVRQALKMLMDEVQRLREDLRQAQTRVGYLEKLADEDSLVPVANRRAFVRELSRMAAFAERYNAPSSVLYFDINGFKQINDKHGHAAGDAALTHVAALLAEHIRESDIVGRLGGDEFGVILAQSDQANAAEKAASLATLITKSSVDWQGVALKLSVSYGAYTFSGGENAGEALAHADRAMYAQKQAKG